MGLWMGRTGIGVRGLGYEQSKQLTYSRYLSLRIVMRNRRPTLGLGI